MSWKRQKSFRPVAAFTNSHQFPNEDVNEGKQVGNSKYSSPTASGRGRFLLMENLAEENFVYNLHNVGIDATVVLFQPCA
jgi:hypothetical protein